MNLDLNLKALAYPASNLSDDEPVTPCLCSLVFRCDDAKLATLLLVVRIPTAHGTANSEFVLQYDSDNLVPGHVKLVTDRGYLKRTQLDELVPKKGKGKQRLDIKLLRLSTQRPSPVWCSASTPTFSLRPGHEPALQRLVELAKETKIHVVFDFSQLHQSYQSSFKAFSKAAQGLKGYPVEAPLIERGLRQVSWEVFAPTEVAGAPPAYNDPRTRKRPRKGKCPETLFLSSTDTRKVPAHLIRRPGAGFPRRRPPNRTRPRRRSQSVPRPKLPHCDTRHSTTTPTSTSMQSWRTESLRTSRSLTPRRPQPLTPPSLSVLTRTSAAHRTPRDSRPQWIDKST